jgi:hypothetical protein
MWIGSGSRHWVMRWEHRRRLVVFTQQNVDTVQDLGADHQWHAANVITIRFPPIDSQADDRITTRHFTIQEYRCEADRRIDSPEHASLTARCAGRIGASHGIRVVASLRRSNNEWRGLGHAGLCGCTCSRVPHKLASHRSCRECTFDSLEHPVFAVRSFAVRHRDQCGTHPRGGNNPRRASCPLNR